MARLRLPALLTALTLLAGGTAATAPAAATATATAMDPTAPVPVTGTLALSGTERDGLVGPRARLYTEADAPITMTSGPRSVHVQVGYHFQVLLAAAEGGRLERGGYEGATTPQWAGPHQPVIDMSHTGNGCGRSTGRFEVLDIARDGLGRVERLWALVEQHCGVGLDAEHAFGEVRVGYPGGDALLAPRAVSWPVPDARVVVPSATVYLRNTGTTSWTPGPSHVEGPAGDDFTVIADGCVGRGLTPGGTCEVEVEHLPTAAGARTADLVVPAPGGVRRVALRGTGLEGYSGLLVQDDPELPWRGVTDLRVGPGEPTLSARGTARGITVSATPPDTPTWTVTLDPGAGDALEAGRHYATTTGADVPAELPRLTLTEGGFRCEARTGGFTVHQAAFAADGSLQRLSATFSAACGDLPHRHGSIAWNATDLLVRPGPDVRFVERLEGPDRYATAVAVSRASHPDGARTVVVASGRGYADALAAGPFAAEVDAPVLLVNGDTVPVVVAEELRRLRPQQVVIAGGTSAVGERAAAELARVAPVRRIAGPNRYATAGALAQAVKPSPVVAFVAAGTDFPDALSAGAAAAASGALLVLTGRDRLPAETLDALVATQPAVIVVVGGETVVSPAVEAQLQELVVEPVVRLAGRDRYETSALTARAFATDAPEAVFLATGTDFPDALAGVPFAALTGGPLLLTKPGCTPVATAAAAREVAPGAPLLLLGGPDVVSERAAAWQPC
ncbi:hypothetical protein NUM3379_29390 [Kineococcus sp. NUM-3379]